MSAQLDVRLTEGVRWKASDENGELFDTLADAINNGAAFVARQDDGMWTVLNTAHIIYAQRLP